MVLANVVNMKCWLSELYLKEVMNKTIYKLDSKMEENKKGIYFNRRLNKYVAQYWNKNLKRTISIGTFDSEQEAIDVRAKHIRDVYDGIINDSLPKTKMLPKGISESNSRYRAIVQLWTGKYKDKKITIYVGSYDTPEEAEIQREQFILNLI